MSHQVNESLKQRSVSDEIVESVFELNIFTGDYLLHQEERALSQWYLKHDSLSNHLTGLEFKNLEDQHILNEISQNHENIKDIFSQLVASYEKQEISGEESALRDILSHQLSLKLQDMVYDATLLSESAQENIISTTQTSNLLITVFVITIAAIIGTNSFLIIKSIAKPIAKLHEGVEKISHGNMNHKVGTSVKDEIGQLSRAFDQMTVELDTRMKHRARAERTIK